MVVKYDFCGANRSYAKKSQQDHYDALGAADARADSSEFVLFMLRLLVEALKEAGDSSAQARSPDKSAPIIFSSPSLMAR